MFEMSTPHLKLESPSESSSDHFGSPGQQYSNLFDDNEPMSPGSYDDDSMFGGSVAGGETPGPESQKKPVKKRKSWGQQLPEPKTNLPPRYILDRKFTIVDMTANPHIRKRAKTEDEKEQRRVERVLRNRRAAQSSRERKRQEVEALEAEKRQIEQRNQDLEHQLAQLRNKDDVQRRNQALEQQLADLNQKFQLMQQQLEAATGNVLYGASVSSPAHTEQFRSAPSPVTLSQELFSSRDSPERSSISSQTVNPASLSPEVHPVVDSSNATFSDLTQQPAALLCDLQCQSVSNRPWTSSTSAAISQILAMTLIASWTILNPLTQIMRSLRERSSLSPTSSILTTIIWLTTTTSPLTTTSSSTSSTTTKTTNPRPRFSLRIRLLNQLLSCSPQLARPLLDATQGEMRLASEQQLSNGCPTGVGSSDRRPEGSPSLESLATLLWAVQCFINREHKPRSPKLDVATLDVRQLSWELGTLFRQREIRMARKRRDFSYSLGGGEQQKALDRWRAALG